MKKIPEILNRMMLQSLCGLRVRRSASRSSPGERRRTCGLIFGF